VTIVGMETAVKGFLKTGIYPLSPNVFPNCTFEPEEAPAITQQDKLNSQNIPLHRNLLELLACKTKYLPLLLLTSGLLQMLCCCIVCFTTRHRDYSQEPKEGKRCISRSKRDGTRAETRFGLSAKRTSPFKSARVSVKSTTASRGVRISGQQLYRPCYDVQCKAAGYQLHSHLSPSLPLPCVTVCHQVLNALYNQQKAQKDSKTHTSLLKKREMVATTSTKISKGH